MEGNCTVWRVGGWVAIICFAEPVTNVRCGVVVIKSVLSTMFFFLSDKARLAAQCMNKLQSLAYPPICRTCFKAMCCQRGCLNLLVIFH